MPTADVRWFTTSDGTRLALYWQGARRVDASTLRAGLGVDASTLRAGLGAPLTIVLAHGWIVDSRIWEPVAGMLSSGPRGRPVLCYDLRGHGQSGHMVQLERAEQVAGRIGELVTAIEANRRLRAE